MKEFNPFTHLLDNESLPPEHKEAVMQTIDMLKLMANMVDLFSVKQARTNTSLISQVMSGGKEESSANPSKDDPKGVSNNDARGEGKAENKKENTTQQRRGARACFILSHLSQVVAHLVLCDAGVDAIVLLQHHLA